MTDGTGRKAKSSAQQPILKDFLERQEMAGESSCRRRDLEVVGAGTRKLQIVLERIYLPALVYPPYVPLPDKSCPSLIDIIRNSHLHIPYMFWYHGDDDIGHNLFIALACAHILRFWNGSCVSILIDGGGGTRSRREITYIS